MHTRCLQCTKEWDFAIFLLSITGSLDVWNNPLSFLHPNLIGLAWNQADMGSAGFYFVLLLFIYFTGNNFLQPCPLQCGLQSGQTGVVVEYKTWVLWWIGWDVLSSAQCAFCQVRWPCGQKLKSKNTLSDGKKIFLRLFFLCCFRKKTLKLVSLFIFRH